MSEQWPSFRTEPILRCLLPIKQGMISHRYKCIFVEVPKTGSTSVRRILGAAIKPHLSLSEIKRMMESNWVIRGGRKDRIMEWLYPMLPAERRKERGRQQFASYFKFGFVRNPWDRVVSLYERNEATQMRQEMTFEEFVRWIQYSSATCVHSSPHRYQLDWFVDADGRMLADFIGRFERLQEDWAVIAKKLGVSETLPHARGNPRLRHYTEYYTPETARLIEEKFKVDIEAFNYRFGD
jgi:Sulfotransferase family